MVLILNIIMVTLMLCLSADLSADNAPTWFTVKPDRCIALYQGQACYQTLKFNWQTPTEGEHCLFDQNLPEPLLCWTGNQKKSYTQDFQSNKNIIYDIRTKDGEKIIASAKVKVAWVYKSNRKNTRRWRLF